MLVMFSISRSERALKGETYTGRVKDFCRNKGHGFIIDDVNHDTVFVHISE